MEGGPGLEIWQIMLIVAVAAVILGAIAGVIAGKVRVKRASKDYTPLLSLKERIVYLSMFALGAGLILTAAFVRFPAGGNGDMIAGGRQDPGYMEGMGHVAEGMAEDITMARPTEGEADITADEAPVIIEGAEHDSLDETDDEEKAG